MQRSALQRAQDQWGQAALLVQQGQSVPEDLADLLNPEALERLVDLEVQAYLYGPDSPEFQAALASLALPCDPASLAALDVPEDPGAPSPRAS